MRTTSWIGALALALLWILADTAGLYAADRGGRGQREAAQPTQVKQDELSAAAKKKKKAARDKKMAKYGLQITKEPKIGEVLDDFELLDLKGKKVRLSDFKEKIFVLELGACT